MEPLVVRSRVWFPPAAMVMISDPSGRLVFCGGSGCSKRHCVGVETSSSWPMPSWPDPLEPKAKSLMVLSFLFSSFLFGFYV